MEAPQYLLVLDSISTLDESDSPPPLRLLAQDVEPLLRSIVQYYCFLASACALEAGDEEAVQQAWAAFFGNKRGGRRLYFNDKDFLDLALDLADNLKYRAGDARTFSDLRRVLGPIRNYLAHTGRSNSDGSGLTRQYYTSLAANSIELVANLEKQCTESQASRVVQHYRPDADSRAGLPILRGLEFPSGWAWPRLQWSRWTPSKNVTSHVNVLPGAPFVDVFFGELLGWTTTHGVRHNLNRVDEAHVRRDRVQQRLDGYWKSNNSAISIRGNGGVGKTSEVLHWAWGLMKREHKAKQAATSLATKQLRLSNILLYTAKDSFFHAGGIVPHQLDDTISLADIISSDIKALGLTEATARKDRRYLWIIDNCETIDRATLRKVAETIEPFGKAVYTNRDSFADEPEDSPLHDVIEYRLQGMGEVETAALIHNLAREEDLELPDNWGVGKQTEAWKACGEGQPLLIRAAWERSRAQSRASASSDRAARERSAKAPQLPWRVPFAIRLEEFIKEARRARFQDEEDLVKFLLGTPVEKMQLDERLLAEFLHMLYGKYGALPKMRVSQAFESARQAGFGHPTVSESWAWLKRQGNLFSTSGGGGSRPRTWSPTWVMEVAATRLRKRNEQSDGGDSRGILTQAHFHFVSLRPPESGNRAQPVREALLEAMDADERARLGGFVADEDAAHELWRIASGSGASDASRILAAWRCSQEDGPWTHAELQRMASSMHSPNVGKEWLYAALGRLTLEGVSATDLVGEAASALNNAWSLYDSAISDAPQHRVTFTIDRASAVYRFLEKHPQFARADPELYRDLPFDGDVPPNSWANDQADDDLLWDRPVLETRSGPRNVKDEAMSDLVEARAEWNEGHPQPDTTDPETLLRTIEGVLADLRYLDA